MINQQKNINLMFYKYKIIIIWHITDNTKVQFLHKTTKSFDFPGSINGTIAK